MLMLLPLSAVWSQCTVNASFVASSVYVCAGETVTFTNTSTGGPTTFTWAENGVPFATSTNATRTFSVVGQFLISLVAANGPCADTVNKVLVVGPAVNSTVTGTNASCFGVSDGSANLSPTGGTPNRSLRLTRASSTYVAANSVSNAGYTNGVTVEGWVHPVSTWTSGDGQIFAFNIGTGGNRFFFGYNTVQQRFVYFDDNTLNQFQTGSAPRGNWYHCALTISTGNVITMYVNGAVVRTLSTSASWQPQFGDFFSIGQEWDGAATSQHFDGFVDELRVWNTLLTQSTIQGLMNECGSIPSNHPNINNLIAYYSMNEGAGTFIFDRSGNDNHGTLFNGNTWGLPSVSNWGCFSAGTGYAYNWSNGATVEDPSGLAAGTYTVTITDGAGCMHNNSVTIGQPAPVVVNLNSAPSDTICNGSSTTLSASGASTYTWSPATGLSGTAGASVTASPTSTTTYTCIGTDGGGCRDTTTITVVVNALPTASIAGNTTICDGDSTTLTASGGTGFAWSNGPMTATNTVNPTSTTTYTVTVTDANGCQDTDQATVTVNALPTIGITGNTTICNGDSTTLTASGGNNYAWSSGDNTAATTVNPTSTTTYTVTVTDANSCSDTSSVSVTVNALPTITFSGQDTICDGASTTITAAGGNSYSWSTGDNTAAITVTPAVGATVYTVTVTDGNSCMNSDSTTVIVNPNPSATITGNDTLCEGDSTLLTAAGGISYSWSTGGMTAGITVTPLVTTDYVVTVTDGNGCTDSDTFTVTVNAAPTAFVSGDTAICSGDSAGMMAVGGGTYLWNTGATTAGISTAPSVTTTYTVTVTGANGCTAVVSHTVTVHALPSVSITQSGNDLIATAGFATYSWFHNGSPLGTTTNIHTATADGDYWVTVTDSNGCTATDSILDVVIAAADDPFAGAINMLVYPNPNDGAFTLQLDVEKARDVTIAVYDVVGQRIFEEAAGKVQGTWKRTLDLSHVAKGVYVLQVSSGSAKAFRKLVIE